MLGSVITARDRWLKPGGLILPSNATVPFFLSFLQLILPLQYYLGDFYTCSASNLVYLTIKKSLIVFGSQNFFSDNLFIKKTHFRMQLYLGFLEVINFIWIELCLWWWLSFEWPAVIHGTCHAPWQIQWKHWFLAQCLWNW